MEIPPDPYKDPAGYTEWSIVETLRKLPNKNKDVSFRSEFNKGKEAAKIRSKKQAIISGSLTGLVIGLSIFNDFPIVVKLLIFIILRFFQGMVMSSNWMQRKFKHK